MNYENERTLADSGGRQLSPGWTEEQAQRVRARLWQLLAVRTKLYTMGDSSSVRVEVAAELTESILYTLGAYQESIGSDIAHIDPEADFEELFDLGLRELNRQLDVGKKAFAALPGELLPVQNQFYQSTPDDIGDFFHQYDVFYFAHQSAGYIGYPLNQEVTGLSGIRYINEYLRRLRIENRFIARFEPDAALVLLRTITPCLQDYVGNFFEPVFAVAIALLLVQKSPFSLNLSDDDRVLLGKRFSKWSDKERTEQFTAQAARLARLPGMRENGDAPYLIRAAELLALQTRASRECSRVIFPSPFHTAFP